MKHQSLAAVLALTATTGIAPLAHAAEPAKPAENAPEAPAQALEPLGPKLGEKAPDATVAMPDESPIELSSIYDKGPIVLVFFRGEWCPYCTKHIKQWQTMVDEVAAQRGYIIGITPDRPGNMEQIFERNVPTFQILHDFNGQAAKNFNLQFTLPLDLQEKYKGYGVNLAARNWDGTWNLPHPATIIIDSEGIVRYVHAEQDYTKRADPTEALEVLKTIEKERAAKPKQLAPEGTGTNSGK
ncbi:MAG: peroxiredoxin-like family protein [Planctomycetota bacterium]|nr:peroxiredoxin-like family protein [Planctomycetota bacterium]